MIMLYCFFKIILLFKCNTQTKLRFSISFRMIFTSDILIGFNCTFNISFLPKYQA